MKKVIFRIIEIFAIMLILLILAVDLILIVKSNKNKDEIPSVFGYKLFIVMSGSMQSRINIGDLVVIQEVDSDILQKDDIIAFRDEKNKVTTHRIMEVIEENGKKSFITKGDSNLTNDKEQTNKDNLEGKMIMNIPKLGHFILFIQKPLGIVLILFTILVVVACVYMMETLSERENIRIKKEYMREFEKFMKQKEEEDSKK